MTNKSANAYSRQLEFQLRLQGVPRRRVLEIISEVRAHVRESGEPPYDTFGEPRAYAAEFAQGSWRRWTWLGAAVLAVAAFVASAYLIAGEIAAHREFRPLPFGGRTWLIVAVAAVAVVVLWRMVLIVATVPLSTLTMDDGDATVTWKKWVRRRRVTSVVVAVVLVFISAAWGLRLGSTYANSPQLRAASYVWASASTAHTQFDPRQNMVAVEVILFQSALGPMPTIDNLSLSANWTNGIDDSSVLLPYSSLTTAVQAAHNHDFSGGGGNNAALGVTLRRGTYYVLQYFGGFDATISTPTPPETLDVSYDVNNGPFRTLRVPLPVDYSNI
jgi:hypothetical protein